MAGNRETALRNLKKSNHPGRPKGGKNFVSIVETELKRAVLQGTSPFWEVVDGLLHNKSDKIRLAMASKLIDHSEALQIPANISTQVVIQAPDVTGLAQAIDITPEPKRIVNSDDTN